MRVEILEQTIWLNLPTFELVYPRMLLDTVDRSPRFGKEVLINSTMDGIVGPR